jgi:hypothetical protein
LAASETLIEEGGFLFQPGGEFGGRPLGDGKFGLGHPSHDKIVRSIDLQTAGPSPITKRYSRRERGRTLEVCRMKRVTVAVILLASAIGLATLDAHAQGMGGPGGGGHKHQQKTDNSDPQKPKADDKAYNAALKSLPDKPYDPWQGAR